MKKLLEAKEIQKAVINNKNLPKKFRVNHELIEIDYYFITKLEELSDEEAIELLKISLPSLENQVLFLQTPVLILQI
jgi:transposase